MDDGTYQTPLSESPLIGTEKTMTARGVTGFCAFISARKSGNFLHILRRFLTKLNRKPGEKGKSTIVHANIT